MAAAEGVIRRKAREHVEWEWKDEYSCDVTLGHILTTMYEKIKRLESAYVSADIDIRYEDDR